MNLLQTFKIMKSICLFLFMGVCYGQKSLLDIYVPEPFEFRSSNESSEGQSTMSLQRIYNAELSILTPTPEMLAYGPIEGNHRVTGFYTDQGLKTVGEQRNFRYLNELLLSGPTSALSLVGGSPKVTDVLTSVIEEMAVRDRYRISDILQIQRLSNVQLLYVAPKGYFNSLVLGKLRRIGSFLVSTFSITPVYSQDPNFKIPNNTLDDELLQLNGGYVPFISELPIFTN